MQSGVAGCRNGILSMQLQVQGKLVIILEHKSLIQAFVFPARYVRSASCSTWITKMVNAQTVAFYMKLRE